MVLCIDADNGNTISVKLKKTRSSKTYIYNIKMNLRACVDFYSTRIDLRLEIIFSCYAHYTCTHTLTDILTCIILLSSFYSVGSVFFSVT